MPKIPRLISQERPTVIPGARVSPESMTQETRAIEQFGQAGIQTGEATSEAGIAFQNKLTDAEITSQYNLSKGTYKEGLKLLREKQVIDKKTDWEDVKKDATEYRKTGQAELDEILKQPKARQLFEAFRSDYDIAFDKESFNRTNSNRVAAVKAQTTSALKLSIELRDPDMARESMAGSIASGDRGEQAGANELKLVLLEIDKGIDEDNYQDVWKVAREAPDKDTADTIIRGAELSAEQEKSLLSTSNSHFLGLEAAAAKEEEEAKEADRASLWDKEKEGTLIYDDIEETGLDQKEKLRRIDRLDDKNKAIAKGEDDPATITDPAVDNSVLQRVFSANPPTVTEIRNMAGSGLSNGRAEHWINILEKPDAGYKRGLDYLKSQIMPSKGLLVGESSAEATAYWKAVMSLDEEIKMAVDSGKPLTGNDILKKAMDVAPLYQMTIQEQIEAMKSKLKKDDKRTVTKTGTLNGRKVVEYDDGSVEYAD